MWEQIVVGLIVVLAVLALLRRWLPRRWLQRLGVVSASAPAQSSACGGCSGCSDSHCGGDAKDVRH